MALWGNKKTDDPEEATNGDSSSHAVQPRASEADERTHLLPPPAEGYLSPDDPAVSRLPIVHAPTLLLVCLL